MTYMNSTSPHGIQLICGDCIENIKKNTRRKC